MKLTAAFLTAATLVSAAPIRIVVVTGAGGGAGKANLESLTAVRFGHAAANANGIPVREPSFMPFFPDGAMHPARPAKHSCKHSFKAKAVAIWEQFTGYIGVKTPSPRPANYDIDADKLAIYTSPGILSPHLREKLRADAAKHAGAHDHHNYPPVSSPPFIIATQRAHQQTNSEPFMYRLSQALSMLGPWEGRAMAFVFGCGLGVLLRMLHVLIIVLVRSRRCKKERGVALPTEEEAPLYVAPPEYILVNEKEEVVVPAVIVVETAEQK